MHAGIKTPESNQGKMPSFLKLLPALIHALGYVAFVPGSPPDFVNISRGQDHEGASAEHFDNSLPRRPPNTKPIEVHGANTRHFCREDHGLILFTGYGSFFTYH